jgi:glycosyltransferase involved in cell wall biosynthesis
METTTRPALTIGMAHFDDFHGLYFTVQALRLYHAANRPEIELVVVDNSPTTPHGQMVKSFLEGGGGGAGFAAVRYVAHAENTGTSATRDLIFTHATGEAVLVMDCHVLLMTDVVDRLLEYYADNPGTPDILSGPLVYDSLQHITTHFDDRWRGEMWGTWGAAWQCGCGSDGVRFALVEDAQMATPRLLQAGEVPVKSCHACGTKIPIRSWPGHEVAYADKGFRPLGHDPDEPAFEIPGMGLGTFSCRRDAWPGFNEHARGFGGEELYIHGKFRARGGRAMCLPWLRWVHRFGRPDGVRYPLTRWNKVRNYVLEFQEMGWDMDPIHAHFVATDLFAEADWARLVADPVGATETKAPGCGGCGSKTKEPFDSLEAAFSSVVAVQRDLNEHMPELRRLAGLVDRVTEFSGRQESTVAFMAGDPKALTSYQMETTKVLPRCLPLVEDRGYTVEQKRSSQVLTIDETDLLFLDGEHTYANLSGELGRYAGNVTRFIVMHDTHIYGQSGEDGGPGLMAAVGDFLRDAPEWSIISHTVQQYGLTVLGRQADDKPQLPGKITMATNLAKAVAGHVASGMGKTEDDLFVARLEVCNLCSQRNGEQCAACGCFLTQKAGMESQQCPLGLWPAAAGDTPAIPPMAGGGA